MLSPGDVVAGKYRIERPLGEGGMGAVYVAINEKLKKRVALKLLRREIANVPGAAERFTREAIAASSAKHPGIIEIYDADTHEGLPWIAMELLEGESLGARVERGPIALPEVLDVVCQALAALAHVHRAGIIHRDLKPDNLFLEELPEGGRRVKILDFGIAASSRSELARVTQTGMAIGTPAYLAPEQAAGQSDLDARVDVYAMGVILFELITGHLPYEAASLGEMVMLMFTRGPTSLSRERPGIPPALSSVIDMCLAVDREHRVQSADALRRELEAVRPLVSALGTALPRTHEVPIVTPLEGPGITTHEISHAATMFAPSAASARGPSPYATPQGSVPPTSDVSGATPPGVPQWPSSASSAPAHDGATPRVPQWPMSPSSAPAHDGVIPAPFAHATPSGGSSGVPFSTPSPASYGPAFPHPVTHATPAAAPRVAAAMPERSRAMGPIGLLVGLGLVLAVLAGVAVFFGAVYLAATDRGMRAEAPIARPPPPPVIAPLPAPDPPMAPLAPVPVPTPEPEGPASDAVEPAFVPMAAPEPTRRPRPTARRRDPEPAAPIAPAVPQPATLAQGDAPRPLDNATIVRVLQANEAALDRCYFDAYPERPRPRVRTEVDLTIASSGRVTESTVTSPRPLLDACVRRVLSAVRFPAHPHSTRARFPMTFHDDPS